LIIEKGIPNKICATGMLVIDSGHGKLQVLVLSIFMANYMWGLMGRNLVDLVGEIGREFSFVPLKIFLPCFSEKAENRVNDLLNRTHALVIFN